MEQYQNMKEELFCELIKLNLETEYNAPNKPEFAKDVNKKQLQRKFNQMIDKYVQSHNISKEDLIKRMLDSINQTRRINKNAKEEHDVLEEILFNILDGKDSKRDEAR